MAGRIKSISKSSLFLDPKLSTSVFREVFAER
jgi:hypothetical protein